MDRLYTQIFLKKDVIEFKMIFLIQRNKVNFGVKILVNHLLNVHFNKMKNKFTNKSLK